MEFANSIGAVFYLTSASTNIGITDLFKDLGKKFLDPNNTLSGDVSKGVKLGEGEKKEKKKKFC